MLQSALACKRPASTVQAASAAGAGAGRWAIPAHAADASHRGVADHSFAAVSPVPPAHDSAPETDGARPFAPVGVFRALPLQRMEGAQDQQGTETELDGVANSLGAACLKIARYISERARDTGNGIEKSSTVGAHNAGNLYVKSNYTNDANQNSSVETWSEMTETGGGYVKRVRVKENDVDVLDHAMNEPLDQRTDFAAALMQDAPSTYASAHGTQGADNASLRISGNTSHHADNITKVVGEGARFGWLAKKLAEGTIGNTSKNVFNVDLKVGQLGTFSMDPTFHQLWQSWDVGFERKYMKDAKTAKTILKDVLAASWRRAVTQQGDEKGAHPLQKETVCTGSCSSLLGSGGVLAAVPAGDDLRRGPKLMKRMAMSFKP